MLYRTIMIQCKKPTFREQHKNKAKLKSCWFSPWTLNTKHLEVTNPALTWRNLTLEGRDVRFQRRDFIPENINMGLFRPERVILLGWVIWSNLLRESLLLQLKANTVLTFGYSSSSSVPEKSPPKCILFRTPLWENKSTTETVSKNSLKSNRLTQRPNPKTFFF